MLNLSLKSLVEMQFRDDLWFPFRVLTPPSPLPEVSPGSWRDRRHLTLLLHMGQMGNITKWSLPLGIWVPSILHSVHMRRSVVTRSLAGFFFFFSQKVIGVCSGQMLKSVLILSVLHGQFVSLAWGCIL